MGYDEYVVNKTINGSQATIIQHADDSKKSYKDSEVVTRKINKLSCVYGKVSPLISTRVKLHDYLGMTLDYRIVGKVRINVYKYIKEMMEDLPERMNEQSSTPAANHLFKVNENLTYFNIEDKEMFHHYVAKYLFLCKRARPDMHPATALLTTRIYHADTDDWKKLARIMKYL